MKISKFILKRVKAIFKMPQSFKTMKYAFEIIKCLFGFHDWSMGVFKIRGERRPFKICKRCNRWHYLSWSKLFNSSWYKRYSHYINITYIEDGEDIK